MKKLLIASIFTATVFAMASGLALAGGDCSDSKTATTTTTGGDIVATADKSH